VGHRKNIQADIFFLKKDETGGQALKKWKIKVGEKQVLFEKGVFLI
jgi:hypothetical protein